MDIKPIPEVLDVLADLLQHIRSLIRSQPCGCHLADTGLNVCRRCLLLGEKK